MALCADDVQSTGSDDSLVVLVADALGVRQGRVVGRFVHLGRVEALPVEHLRGQSGGVAAEQDVGAAAGHVGGDGDGAGPTCLGHDRGLLLVELGVEHLVLDAAALEHLGQPLGLLDRDGADQDRAARFVHVDDLVDQGHELAVLVAEDEVRVVVADHGPVGRDRHHF